MWLFDQDNFLTKQPMAETPVTQDKEAFNAFVSKYNLDPLNHLAIMNCLFEMNEKIDRFVKRIVIAKKVRTWLDWNDIYLEVNLLDTWNQSQ